MFTNTTRFIRLPELIQLTGLSRSTIYARINKNSPSFDPTFPKQVKLSPHPRGTSAWSLNEVEAWLASCMNQRRRDK